MRRVFLFLGMFLFCFNSFALEGTITDVFCGEMDPIVVGDACLIDLNSSGERNVVFFDFDEFQDEYSEKDQQDMIGWSITIASPELITDGAVAVAMDFLGNDITFYNADLYAIELK